SHGQPTATIIRSGLTLITGTILEFQKLLPSTTIPSHKLFMNLRPVNRPGSKFHDFQSSRQLMRSPQNQRRLSFRPLPQQQTPQHEPRHNTAFPTLPSNKQQPRPINHLM